MVRSLGYTAIIPASAWSCFQKCFICINSISSHHCKVGIIMCPILWVRKQINYPCCPTVAPGRRGRVCALSAKASTLRLRRTLGSYVPGPSLPFPPLLLSRSFFSLCSLPWKSGHMTGESLLSHPSQKPRALGLCQEASGLLLSHLSGCQRAGQPVHFSYTDIRAADRAG